MRDPLTHARRTTLAVALALVDLAACADSHIPALTGVGDTAPSASVNVGYRNTNPPLSFDNVLPTFNSGNLSGEGGAACSTIPGAGSTGYNIDGATSTSIAGYRFTVSGGGTTLAFAPIPGSPSTSVITAIVMKGGPAYFVYNYAQKGGAVSDAQLVSPINNGGQRPTISHYIVCFGPGGPALKKTFIGSVILDAMGNMMTDPAYTPGAPVAIPVGETRWLEFTIAYRLPLGVTAILSDLVPAHGASCAPLGLPSNYTCDTSGFDNAHDQTTTVSGVGTAHVLIDVHNTGDCRPGMLTNTATLAPSGGSLLSASATVAVYGVSGPHGMCRTM